MIARLIIDAVKDRYGHQNTVTYNANNDPLTTKDWLGHQTTYGYDALGNRISLTDPLNHISTITIPTNNYGLPSTTTDALGHTVHTDTWDANGYPTHSTDANGNGSGTTIYNALGWLTQFTAVSGAVTNYTYDQWGRTKQATKTAPNGAAYITGPSTTSSTYDAQGNVLTVTDPDNFTGTSTYDDDGRVKTVTDGHADTITYNYDSTYGTSTQKGLLSSVINGNGKTTTFEYTARNEPKATHYPDGTSETINAYDPNGNVLSA